MTKPKERICIRAAPTSVRPTDDAIARFAYDVLRCFTCAWAVRKGDECAEQEFVLGCIHWKRRES